MDQPAEGDAGFVIVQGREVPLSFGTAAVSKAGASKDARSFTIKELREVYTGKTLRTSHMTFNSFTAFSANANCAEVRPE